MFIKFVVITLILAVPVSFLLFRYPRINDITTTPERPPSFTHADPSPYPRDFGPKQQAGYPDLKPYSFHGTPQSLFAAASAVAAEMPNWQITVSDPNRLTLEAVATTPLMKFKDDVVVEIRSTPEGGSELHMRSRSRLGKSDLGANAKRIREFIERLDTRLKSADSSSAS